MGEHGNAYRNLFSRPEMVRDLLLEFVPHGWVKGLDMATLEFQSTVDPFMAVRVLAYTALQRAAGLIQTMPKALRPGEAALLPRLITRRFGEPSAAIQARLNGATRAELERWANRILDADTLEATFK